jgi:anti-anti-sigma regulatory factor
MFVLAGLQPAVQKMITIAQLDKVLTIVPTSTEAISLLNER